MDFSNMNFLRRSNREIFFYANVLKFCDLLVTWKLERKCKILAQYLQKLKKTWKWVTNTTIFMLVSCLST